MVLLRGSGHFPNPLKMNRKEIVHIGYADLLLEIFFLFASWNTFNTLIEIYYRDPHFIFHTVLYFLTSWRFEVLLQACLISTSSCSIAFIYFLPPCHVLVILVIFQLLCSLWWSPWSGIFDVTLVFSLGHELHSL